jgi:hypothetical protein
MRMRQLKTNWINHTTVSVLLCVAGILSVPKLQHDYFLGNFNAKIIADGLD